MKEIKEYCPWQKKIFEIMTRKGYEFDRLDGTGTHPLFYSFKKKKQIGENRYREFRMTIIVNNADDWYKFNTFSADYRLGLCDYSLNEKGHINNYWGKSPYVTANSHFWKGRTDIRNFIKELKYNYPY